MNDADDLLKGPMGRMRALKQTADVKPLPWSTAPIRAAIEVGKWLFDGALIDQAMTARRLEICQGCDHWKKDAVIPYCKLCKCTAAKLYFPSTKCEAGKW